MNKLTLFPLIALGFTGAFYLGRWTAPNPQIEQHPQHPMDAPLIAAPFLPQPPAIAFAEPQPHVPAHPSYQGDKRQMQNLLQLAKSSPEAALEQTQSLKGEIRRQAQEAILSLWAATNPAGAWHWLELNQPQNNPAFVALLASMGLSQPQATLDFADSFARAHSNQKKDIYLAAIQGLARGGNYDSATFLIDYLDQGEGIKGALINALIDQWAVYEPEAALQWLRRQPANLGEPVMGRLGAVWAESDPEAATRFAQQSSGEQHQQLLETAFDHWLQNDPQAAASWINAQPGSVELDPLLSQLAERLGSDSNLLNQALDVVGRINDSQLRLNSLLGLLSRVKQANTTQASSYINQLTYLNATERKQLFADLALTP